MGFETMSHHNPMLRQFAIGFPETTTRLGKLERKVVTLSRRDGLASLMPRSRFAALIRRPFGLPGVNRLADPRLETLRRYAVKLRHGGDALAAGCADDLVASGFTPDQVAHARWLVARERQEAKSAPRYVNRVTLGCAILVSVWIGMLAETVTQDRVIGLVVGLLFAATAAPIVSLPIRRPRRRIGVAIF